MTRELAAAVQGAGDYDACRALVARLLPPRARGDAALVAGGVDRAAEFRAAAAAMPPVAAAASPPRFIALDNFAKVVRILARADLGAGGVSNALCEAPPCGDSGRDRPLTRAALDAAGRATCAQGWTTLRANQPASEGTLRLAATGCFGPALLSALLFDVYGFAPAAAAGQAGRVVPALKLGGEQRQVDGNWPLGAMLFEVMDGQIADGS